MKMISKHGLISQLIGHHIGMPEKFDKPINYIMTGSGLKTVRENKIGVFVTKADTVPGLEKLEDSFIMKLPKMPASILFEIIAFFKWVNTEHDTEAMIHVYFDEQKQQYFCYCPKQKVSGANVKFDKNVELEKQHLLVMDIHSHNTMGAFFSGTDDKDEKETRIFGVIGEIKNAMPEMKFRAGSGDSKIENLKIEDIFEINSSFPEEWKQQVEKEKITTYVTTQFGASDVDAWDDKGWKNRWKNKYTGDACDKNSVERDMPPLWLKERKKKKKGKNKKNDIDEFNSGEFIMEMVEAAEELPYEDIRALVSELELVKKQKEMDEFNKEASRYSGL